jgi:hypothetical protein
MRSRSGTQESKVHCRRVLPGSSGRGAVPGLWVLALGAAPVGSRAAMSTGGGSRACASHADAAPWACARSPDRFPVVRTLRSNLVDAASTGGATKAFRASAIGTVVGVAGQSIEVSRTARNRTGTPLSPGHPLVRPEPSCAARQRPLTHCCAPDQDRDLCVASQALSLALRRAQ